MTRAGIGRTPGIPNKTTKNVKNMLQLAFEGIGGLQRLIKEADKEPLEFYKLWIKLLPIQAQISATVTQVQPVVNVSLAPARVIDHDTGKVDG